MVLIDFMNGNIGLGVGNYAVLHPVANVHVGGWFRGEQRLYNVPICMGCQKCRVWVTVWGSGVLVRGKFFRTT